MNKPIFFVSLIVLVGILFPSVANAQQLSSGYFTDGYLYRFKANPAFGNDQSFVSFPGVGDLNVAYRGNARLTDFVFRKNGQDVTFLNENVGTQEFLGNLNDYTHLGVSAAIPVMSFGFKGFHGYNTISVSASTSASLKVPKDLFRLLKEGTNIQSYDISHAAAHLTATAEVALNHSHQITKDLRIGATLKILVGAGDLDMNFEKAKLTLDGDYWTAVTNGKVQASVKNMEFMIDENNESGDEYVDDFDLGSFGISGFGAAIDLGAEYKFRDFKFSLALLDLGFMHWSDTYVASTDGDQTLKIDKDAFENNVEDGGMGDEWEEIGDNLSDLYELKDMGNIGGRSTSLATTMNLGVEYTLPMYKKLSFGLLNTTRFQSDYTWTEFRLSANFAPCKFFSMGITGAVGTFGSAFGWIVNLHPTGFNLFVGMDHTIFGLSEMGIPSSKATSVNLGVNFPF